MSVKVRLYEYIIEEGYPVSFMNRDFLGIKEDNDELAKIFKTSKQNVYMAIRRLVQGELMLVMKITSFRHDRRLLLIRLHAKEEKFVKNFTNIQCVSLTNKIRDRIQKGPKTQGSPDVSKNNKMEEPYTYEVGINHKESSIHKDTSILDTTTHKDTSILNTSNTSTTSNTSRPEGYYASEYAPGGSRHGQNPRSKKSEFVRYFMSRIYSMHKIDYYIPKTRLGKYYTRSVSVMDLLGGIEEAKKYIDWYLSREHLKSQGYNLDLMVSSPMLNQYQAGDPGETKKGFSRTMVLTDEERKKLLKKAVIL
jgi:hypothetical protein